MYKRQLGEFGATITFVSNIPGETQTLALAIYALTQTPGGDELTPVALREHGFTDIVHKPTPGSVLVEVLCGHLPHWTPRRLRVGQAR